MLQTSNLRYANLNCPIGLMESDQLYMNSSGIEEGGVTS